MFSGELEFCSNFSRHPAVLDGVVYPTAENAFQAAKTPNPYKRHEFGFEHCSPGDAKRRGRSLELRTDWEQIKLPVMRHVLASKFTLTLGLSDKLIATGNLQLIETNTWHDNIWGDCQCGPCQTIPGLNLIGSSLMWLRAYLAGWV